MSAAPDAKTVGGGAECALCGGPLGDPRAIGRLDTCPACERDLHACLQCRFYDPQAHHECREPQAEYVHEKDRANFCDYFELLARLRGTRVDDPKGKAKAALDTLFGKRRN